MQQKFQQNNGTKYKFENKTINLFSNESKNTVSPLKEYQL